MIIIGPEGHRDWHLQLFIQYLEYILPTVFALLLIVPAAVGTLLKLVATLFHLHVHVALDRTFYASIELLTSVLIHISLGSKLSYFVAVYGKYCMQMIIYPTLAIY